MTASQERTGALSPEAARRQALRRQMKQARNALPPKEREVRSARAVERLAQSPLFQEAQTVMIYDHVGGELSLDSLLDHPASAGKTFCYPLCVSRTEMIAMVPGGWQTGAYGIREPIRELSREVPPEKIDLVVCPGTAFDAACHRLGMGGGYYDRYLPKCISARIVMVAYELQRVDSIPSESWDRPVERVFTEERAYGSPDAARQRSGA